MSDTQANKHTFDKPKLRQVGRDINSNDSASDEQSNSGAKFFDKPALRATAKDTRSDSFGDSPEPSHTFEKPVLKNTGIKPYNTGTKTAEHFSPGTFEKPALKKASPTPEREVKDVPDSKGMFEKPALRKTDVIKEPERERTPDKPSWLQEAANKQSKVLDVLQTKGVALL